MRTRTPVALTAAAAVAVALTAGAAGAAAVTAPRQKVTLPLQIPLPRLMHDTGGGTQLLTVTAPTLASTTATLVQWEKTGNTWKNVGSTPARLGAKGLVEGAARKQSTNTTPTGLFGLPFAFGNAAAPAGTTLTYRPVASTSWWCEDVGSASYNRWVSPLPKDCRASESERLADYPTQYAHAVVIDFNYAKPVKGRGAGIFLHVNGSGATAGCVSVPAAAMNRILAWLKPGAAPHIAIGTQGGSTGVAHY